jgi:DUF4097 and DUF4098 domain-containing protein YvlB
MKRFLLSAVALLLANTALGAQERSTTLDVVPDARVRINNPTGPTTVVAWDRGEVQVVADGAMARDVNVRSDRRRVDISAPASIALTVRVPKGVVLDVRSGSGPIQIRGVENAIEAESGSGPISIDATARSITATGFSGGVAIRGGGTEITRAESASGSVMVTQARGVVDLSSSSGSVMANGRVRDGRLFSVSGSVSFDGIVDDGGRLSLESSSGSVSLRLPANTSAEYELSTVQGHIVNSFGPRADVSSIGVGSNLRFSVRGGGARVKASTVTGSVQLNDR